MIDLGMSNRDDGPTDTQITYTIDRNGKDQTNPGISNRKNISTDISTDKYRHANDG